MKKIYAFLLFIFCVSAIYAQTYVSGGIYANTTWAKINSPYIVTASVVVFPGFTLTIEAGVTVKFDDATYLEIRSAALIAIGTVSDTIIFTSNSLTPVPGIWGHGTEGGVWINGSTTSAVNFWKVEYATAGLTGASISIKNSVFTDNLCGIKTVSVPIDSCIFKYNETAIGELRATMSFSTITKNTYGVGFLDNGTLSHCIIDSNQTAVGGISGDIENGHILYCDISYNVTGLHTDWATGSLIDHCTINHNSIRAVGLGNDNDQVTNCEIKFNGIGISVAWGFSSPCTISNCDISNNNIGIEIYNTAANIHCNRICNNTSYGLQMDISYPMDASNNFWCTSDSASTAALIYDGYDDVSLGIATFLPADTSLCYAPAGITAAEVPLAAIFPNPSNGKFTISHLNTGLTDLRILNQLGEIVYREKLISAGEVVIDPHLSPALYFVQLVNNNGTMTRKLVIR